ncbi:MAG: PHP domain-containing protein [Nitrospirae bacterium]|nr:PHP domain-containing protein [Nitrospirota bacterium]
MQDRFSSLFSGSRAVISDIVNYMLMKIDLHVHSANSGDNPTDPEEAIIAAIERGLDGIAFTEHYFYGASEGVEILREKYGDEIMILRGVEFSADEGHCLVFGVDTDGLSIKYAPVADLVRIVTEHGGVVIPSHPYRGLNSIGDRVKDLEGLCALEGYNGCNMHPFNTKAIDTARALSLPFTGGSDAHAAGEIGSCYTEFRDRVTYDNFIGLLKEGRYTGIETRKISRMWLF